ncbi:MAG TPA: hypothetical protein ENO09_02675 [bacterium]|nr:hypothetical protein [bacterium]
MRQTKMWWLASALVALVLGGVLLLDFSSLRAPPAVFSGAVVSLPLLSDCNPVLSPHAQEGCRAQDSSRAMTLKMSGDVRPLRPFELRLILPETVRTQATEASVEFVMVGMDMGINRYTLLKQANGDFGGKVILPVCSIGRSDWVAKLSVVVSLADGGAQEMWTAEMPFTAEPSVVAHD